LILFADASVSNLNLINGTGIQLSSHAAEQVLSPELISNIPQQLLVSKTVGMDQDLSPRTPSNLESHEPPSISQTNLGQAEHNMGERPFYTFKII